MEWSFHGRSPVFMQICDLLRTEILCGRYPPGAQFPTVRQLASEAAVNPNTMQRALSALEEEGLLQSGGTQGRFVTDNPEVLASAKDALQRKTVQSFLAGAARLGISPADIIRIIEEQEEKG